MKVSLNWVKEFVDVQLSVDELVEKIGAQLGAVEEVIDLGKKYQGIVIAKIVKCEKHPDADKLQICTIDDGGNTPNVNRDGQGYVRVVCGAPNAREGLLVAWLPPGTVVPATYDKDPLTLDAREIRGVVSNGMLASAHELALSDDHSGIVELSFGVVGREFAKEFGLDDHVIDIENKMFTHRPDCFGILGVAREIAGITNKKFTSPEWYKNPIKTQKHDFQGGSLENLEIDVRNETPELVPRFMAQVIEGVRVKPSPVWMQAYLSRVGIRPINNVVDVTNYVMYLTAQPLHAYDYDKLCKVAGTKTAQLEARLSKKGDKIKMLNGKELTLEDEETILITSNDVPVGIGGVMGGADTEVDESTKNIVLECANFDMYAIRRASMRHGLFTDAVTRFNKGQSYLQVPAVLQKSIGWVTQLAGGKSGKIVDNHQELQHPPAVQVTEQFINERLGLNLSAEEMAMLLTSVEFKVEITPPNYQLLVTPPFWRTDIEIPEDIVEEVGRLYGYDHLPLELPKRDLTPAPKNELLELKVQIRETLSKAGSNELLTYSFVHSNLLDKVGQDKEKAFQISNALSPELQYYRLSLTPSLLEKVHPNVKAGYDEFAIFEIGKAHVQGETDADEPDLPKEVNVLSFVHIAARDNHASAGAPYFKAKKYLDMLLEKSGTASVVQFEPLDGADLYSNPWLEQMTAPFEPRRSAVLRSSDNLVWGVVGEYKATVKRYLKLPVSTAGFEIDSHLLTHSSGKTGYVPIPRFPKVQQDISLRVTKETNYGQAYKFLQDNLEMPAHTTFKLEPLDIYEKEDNKHMTFRLSITSYERTLTDQEINKLLDDVSSKAAENIGAKRI